MANKLFDKLLKQDIFRPEFLLVYYIIFLIFAAASFFAIPSLQKPSFLSFAVIFATFPFFILGIKTGSKIYSKKIPLLLSILILFFLAIYYSFILKGMFPMSVESALFISFSFSITFFLAIYYFVKKSTPKFLEQFKYLLLAVGAVSFLIALYKIGGIPLLNPELKIPLINNIFFGIGFMFFFAGYALILPEIKNKKYLLLSIFLATAFFSLSAFRTAILPVFLIGILVLYNKGHLKNKKVILPLIAAFLIIVFVGYLARPMLSPFELFLHRAGTTHLAFDKIVQESYPFGKYGGDFFLHGNPRNFFSMEFFGIENNITYTMLGAAFLDFGLIGGMAWMFILGFLLSLSYNSRLNGNLAGFYPLLFVIALLFIETGVDPLRLILFWLFLFAYMMKNTVRKTFKSASP